MSYILDALKRAESERERGVVPGLHSQAVPLRRPVSESGAFAKPLILVGAASVLALLGVLAWRSLGPATTEGNTPVFAVSPTIVRQVITVAPTPAPASAAIASVPAPNPSSGASPAIQAAKPAIRPAKPKPETAQGLKPQPVVDKVISITEPASPRILPIGELPADVRQSLPKVVISGSTYSDNQALRMLVINGEVFREGEKPAPGLQLEQIRAKAAVLNFKGLRYSVAY